MNITELNLLRKLLVDSKSVLDLGCGPHSIVQHLSFKYSLGVDIFEPYIKTSKEQHIHSNYLIQNITQFQCKPKSFDAVIAFDVLEHLTKTQALQMLSNMNRWASRVIIIRTSNGFQDQVAYHNNIHQIHQCGFSVAELKDLGYKLYGTGFPKGTRQLSLRVNPTPYDFHSSIPDFLKNIGYYYVKHFPHLATALLCVKKVSD